MTVLLSTARDWVMTVDLERQLKVPPHITQSRLRPDIILVSEATKQLFLLGGENGERKKQREVPGAGGGLSEEWVEDQMYASGGGQ